MNYKSFLQSKTFWTGAMMVIGAGIDVFLNGGDTRSIVMACMGAIVVVLRRFTSEPMLFTRDSNTTTGNDRSRPIVVIKPNGNGDN